MTVTILVEPTAGGFRARTGGPLDLAAEGPTGEAAVAALGGLVADRLAGGAYLTAVAVNPGAAFAVPELADNPMWDAFLDAMLENRRAEAGQPRPEPVG
jgi:hypothetical protein